MSYAVASKKGARPSNEDRAVVVSNPFGRADAFFGGVFDGTVTPVAVDEVVSRLAGDVLNSRHFAAALECAPPFTGLEPTGRVAAALVTGFRACDEAVVRRAKEMDANYSAATAVTVTILGDLLSVAHVGDSRCVLGVEVEGQGALAATLLTVDHKPNDVGELRRIVRAGGALTFLHGGRPFLRGGDFAARHKSGDRPMSL